MKQVLAAVLGAGLLLAGCGQNTPTVTAPSGAPVATYGDGLDHSWTASTAEGQRLYAALSQGLKSQDFTIGLSVTATSGWGPIELNTSNGETPAGDGKPITLNGQVYSTGLGVHANSEIHIHATNLQTPACTRFQADVGLDDEVGDKGSVVFQVFADGVKLFDSGVMTGASATQHVDVGIGNKSDLQFVVTDAGDNNYYDHADWAGAALSCVAPQATPSITLDKSSLDIYHLHTGTLKATFNNYPKGKVQVALLLAPDLPLAPDNHTPPSSYPFNLKTTEVELAGLPSETKDIVVDAPINPGVEQIRQNYSLNVSGSGVADQHLIVGLLEQPLKLSVRFEPNSFSGRVGETKTGVAVFTVDPPLDSPHALLLGAVNPEIGPNNFYDVNIIGPATGTGAEMRSNFTVTVGPLHPEVLPSTYGYNIAIGLEGVTSGYRDNFYSGSTARDTLYLTHLP